MRTGGNIASIAPANASASGGVAAFILENRSRQPEATDPMATYDFTWLWRELKVEHLRR
jgi:hypothetical protein